MYVNNTRMYLVKKKENLLFCLILYFKYFPRVYFILRKRRVKINNWRLASVFGKSLPLAERTAPRELAFFFPVVTER